MSSVPKERRGLGRGLEVLLGEAGQPELLHLPVETIHPNPRQPRRRFEPESAAGLASSISVAFGSVLLVLYFNRLEKYIHFRPGLWQPRFEVWRRMINIGVELPGGLPYQPWLAALVKERWARNAVDDPHVRCFPDNFLRAYGTPHLLKFVQTPNLLIVLNE